MTSPKPRSALSALLLAVLSLSVIPLLTGCAGYRVGNIGGERTQGVRSVYVPMATNKSIVPGIHNVVTSAVVRRFENDGTVQTNDAMNADADLQINILNVRRTPSRATKGDSNITSEYLLTIDAEAFYTNRKTGKSVRLVATGESNFFVQQDQQEGERQSLPLAAENLAYNIVKQITEGW